MKVISAVLSIFFLSSGILWAEPEKKPGGVPSDYQIAVEHLKAEDYDLAIENFQKAIVAEKTATGQARIYNLIGVAYMKQDISPQSAIGSFQQAVELDPQLAEAYFNIASIYASKENNPTKAAEYFQKTIDVDPKYTRAYFGLGWFSLIQQQDALKALELFDKTIADNPDFAEAYYGQGMAYIQLQKAHMALGAVSRLRGLQRDDLAATLEKIIIQVSPPQGDETAAGTGSGEGQNSAAKSPFQPPKPPPA
ncbi:MAG TPA: hypothetical protein DIS66_08085 [Candidatus Omnitrophica bacterium]|nr:hypothetical protein [Candidatus Omnitrophota bacterium]